MGKLAFVISLLALTGCSKMDNISPAPPGGGAVTTYAGNGITGFQNGQAGSAEFDVPSDVAVDIYGNVYVSDRANNVIRRISGAGQVTTFAGTGTAGYKEGAAASAEFSGPEGLVFDSSGNLYIADNGNNVIREINTFGEVSTYAGDGKAGYRDGAGSSAEFASPTGLAIDKSRNLYIADFGNNVVRRIASDGSVSTFAGNSTAGFVNGSTATATFHGPSGIAIDGFQNLYIADANNGAIRRISATGQVSTLVAGLLSPVRVAADGSANIYASCADNTIVKVTSGKSAVYAGTGVSGFNDGPLLTASFSVPMGLYIDSRGNLLVADSENNRIRLIAP